VTGAEAQDEQEQTHKSNSAAMPATKQDRRLSKEKTRAGTDAALDETDRSEFAADEDCILAVAGTDGEQHNSAVGLLILPGQVLTEADLARAFKKHPVTIRRAVERGELPEPVRLMGKPTWTGSVILKHLEGRLARTREEAQVLQRHRASLPKDTLK
jgi:hypothetical protein